MAGMTPQDRLADAISGERRNWHRVEVEPDDIAALLDRTEALAGFADSNAELFAEYVRGWYPAARAARILGLERER